MLIIGVDPGKVTGWASYRVGGDWLGSHEAPADEFLDTIEPWIRGTAPADTLLAVERFVITAGTLRVSRGDENWSIEQIGVLRHLARWTDLKFELQSASDAKNFAPDSRLRDIGWHARGRGHANDAARHVLLAVGRHAPADLRTILSL